MSENEAGQRLDRFVSDKTGASRNRVQNHIQKNCCSVNGRIEKPSYKLKSGDAVEYAPPEPVATEVIPQDIPLNVVYEDSDVIVINKPAGMVVHPAAGNPDGTLVNALLFHCKDMKGIGDVQRPGIVHRIDKDTSGLLVVAKNDEAHAGLSEQFAVHDIEREYHLFCFGSPDDDKGTFNRPISRHPNDRKRFTSLQNRGKTAVTHWHWLARLGSIGYGVARLETGRTHQIRVHFSDAGLPIVGDPVYTHPRRAKHLTEPDVRIEVLKIKRQALHAKTLGFRHPITGEALRFSSALPEDMDELLQFLTKRYGSFENNEV